MKKYKGSYASYIITYFFYFFCMAVPGSVLSIYLRQTGKTAAEMSFIVSAASLFSIIMLPIVGYLNDKLQKPKLIGSILLLFAGAFGILFSISHEVWILFILNGFMASCISSFMSISEKMASSSKYRYGTIRVWGTLGYAAGAQIAGFALEQISENFIFILLVIAAVMVSIGLLGVNNPAPDKSPEEKPKSEKSLVFLKDRNFILYLMIVILVSGSFGVNMIYVPVLMAENGIRITVVGTILFFSTIVEIPLIVFSNRFMDKIRGTTLMRIMLLIAVVQFICYGFFSGSQVVLVGVIVFLKAVASTLLVMINLKVVRNIVGLSYTSTALGILSSVSSLGGVLLQNLSGLFVDMFNIPMLYLVLVGFMALALILSYFLKIGNDERVFS